MNVTSLNDIRSWIDSHKNLWRLEEFLAIARFHAHVHDANEKLTRKLADDLPGELEGFRRLELTAMGRKVGGDIPRWWVFSREQDVQGLHNSTENAFSAAQKLLRSSEGFGLDPAVEYKDIVEELCRFLRDHGREIGRLLQYAVSLQEKNEHAPAILFSYAVWGTTRRAERSLLAKSTDTDVDFDARLHHAGELALGLRRQHEPTVFGEWNDLLDEAQFTQGDEQPVAVPAARLLHRTQLEVRNRFTEYFAQIRDSFRHIDSLCQEFSQRENLFADDRFVRSFLQKVSRQPSAVETDLWDIKETLDVWAVTGAAKKEAAIGFVELVAAFANGRGGLILIGVEDRTHAVVGVRDPENRIKHILSMIGLHADSEADFVQVRPVEVDSSGSKATCIVVVVGETESPIGVRRQDNTYAYPLRVGPGIERVSLKQLSKRKAHKKGTSFAFAQELNEWVLGAS